MIFQLVEATSTFLFSLTLLDAKRENRRFALLSLSPLLSLFPCNAAQEGVHYFSLVDPLALELSLSLSPQALLRGRFCNPNWQTLVESRGKIVLARVQKCRTETTRRPSRTTSRASLDAPPASTGSTGSQGASIGAFGHLADVCRFRRRRLELVLFFSVTLFYLALLTLSRGLFLSPTLICTRIGTSPLAGRGRRATVSSRRRRIQRRSLQVRVFFFFLVLSPALLCRRPPRFRISKRWSRELIKNERSGQRRVNKMRARWFRSSSESIESSEKLPVVFSLFFYLGVNLLLRLGSHLLPLSPLKTNKQQETASRPSPGPFRT